MTSHLSPLFRVLGVIIGVLAVVTWVVTTFMLEMPQRDWMVLLFGIGLLYQSGKELRYFGMRRIPTQERSE